MPVKFFIIIASIFFKVVKTEVYMVKLVQVYG